eukprot:202898-Amphidinium_carterae.1
MGRGVALSCFVQLRRVSTSLVLHHIDCPCCRSCKSRPLRADGDSQLWWMGAAIFLPQRSCRSSGLGAGDLPGCWQCPRTLRIFSV